MKIANWGDRQQHWSHVMEPPGRKEPKDSRVPAGAWCTTSRTTSYLLYIGTAVPARLVFVLSFSLSPAPKWNPVAK